MNIAHIICFLLNKTAIHPKKEGVHTISHEKQKIHKNICKFH